MSMPYSAFRRLCAATSLSVPVLAYSIASAQPPAKQSETAKTFVTQMAAGQFEKAVEPFDQAMAKALPPERLKALWEGLVKEYGPFQQAAENRAEKILQYNAVYITCAFEGGSIDAKVVLNSRNKIVGLFFVPSATYKPPAKQSETAKTFVTQMAAGQFEKAVEPFDQAMAKALPAERLKALWEGLVKEHGPFQQAAENRAEEILQYNAVYITCAFEGGSIDAKVVLNSRNKIVGLFFVPSAKYKPPAYADPSKFDESEVQIGKGLWVLPGTLSLPKGDGPWPAVILVHGSGPQDRDETIGPNKPFRDLAQGLASRGIAALRYEKRTQEHKRKMAALASGITVKEETIDDVAAAFDFLASQPKIDPRRIVVLGHSLGGMLIPRIAAAQDKIAGFVSLAGSTKPLEDSFLEQMKYLLSLDEKPSEESKKKVQEIEEQMAEIKALKPAESAGKLILGAPAAYWLDLRGYDPAKEAAKIRQPLLILQGERDYQVTMDNFANWKKALQSRKDVSFITYPALNHLFVEGKGKSTPAEYSNGGNVAQVVIDDIAKWIGGLKKAQ
jgi:dienelactone hydrolase